jgi:hypothetical protein
MRGLKFISELELSAVGLTVKIIIISQNHLPSSSTIIFHHLPSSPTSMKIISHPKIIFQFLTKVLACQKERPACRGRLGVSQVTVGVRL